MPAAGQARAWQLVVPLRRPSTVRRPASAGRRRPLQEQAGRRGRDGRRARPGAPGHGDPVRPRPHVRRLPRRVAGREALAAGHDPRLLRPPHRALPQARPRGHIRLSDLRDSDFEELYAAMRLIGRPRTGPPSAMLERLLAVRTDTKQARRPLTPNRIRTVHATVRSALNAAVKRRKIAYHPALFVELERVAKPRALVWTDERIAQWRGTRQRPPPRVGGGPRANRAVPAAGRADPRPPPWGLRPVPGGRRP